MGVFGPCGMRIQPGEHGCTAGAATARCDKSVGKTDAFTGKTVEVFCPDGWMAAAAQVAIAEIIGNDKDNIRRLLMV